MDHHAFGANSVYKLEFQTRQSHIDRLCLKQKLFITLKGIKSKNDLVSSKVVELR